MKNSIFILFLVFTFCSCASDNGSFERISKEEMMESWAWKIFIFTDEGETMPAETVKNNFGNPTKDKPIFVDDVWKIDTNGNLLSNNQKLALEDEIENSNFAATKRKK
jgi:hypothetical protein